MDYLPLRFINNTISLVEKMEGKPFVYGTAFSRQINALRDITSVAHIEFEKSGLATCTEEDYMKATLCSDFLTENNPLYPTLNKTFIEIAPYIMECTGLSPSDFEKNNKLNIRTELKDALDQFIILDKWAVNKQVLKPDKTFAYHLIQTEKLRISKAMLDHLPYNNFYVDLSDCKSTNIFGDIEGIFINITKITEEEYALSLYNIDSQAVSFSHYSSIFFDDEHQDIEIEATEFPDEETVQLAPLTLPTETRTEVKMMAKNLKVFVMQLLCYISIPDADIEESTQMKSTYHPNKTIKNKFREVYVRDIGIKIGSAITKKKKQVIQEYQNSTEYRTQKNRKPPVAHFRRAHWHRYWTGTGRTDLITKWVEPTFVCGAATDITIHPVKD